MLISNEKAQTSDAYNSTKNDEPKKPDTKEPMLYDSFYRKF